jgi:hypothetical protein
LQQSQHGHQKNAKSQFHDAVSSIGDFTICQLNGRLQKQAVQ